MYHLDQIIGPLHPKLWHKIGQGLKKVTQVLDVSEITPADQIPSII